MQTLSIARTASMLTLAVLFSLPVSAQISPPTLSANAGTASTAGPTPIPQHVTLKEAAQAAVLKSPDVQARWHAFREAAEEIDVAQGGFLPKVDISAGSGRQKTVQKRVGTDASYSGNETTLSLRQMLFDGFATSNEVKRLGKAKLVRYFELLDASENIALEAGRAYLDVVRFRYQVVLAEENYIQHQAAFEQLKQRAESGVGKRVDVDQAASRLALADVNLTTAYANLHDVMARYVRIVGEPPAKVMFAPEQLGKALPKTTVAALAVALKRNPALRASIENIEASQYDLEARRSAYMPKLDLVARRDDFSNYQGDGSRDDSRIELRLNYNLFNGGSDVARSRQYRERKNIALDQREKSCRDMRQTLSIAFNETVRLNEQLSYIGLQVNLVEKTRTAYRDQFNIGQRTLLDLLNTQNEYFDARRSQVNADADLSIAYLRSYAGMGSLLETLGLKQVDVDNTPDENDLTPVDLAQLCPATTPLDATLDREALARKAREMLDSSSSSFIGSRPQPLGGAGAKGK
jgi:adhesin transport system outer membrane protein